MTFKVCTICGTGPMGADVPHELPSPDGHPPMRFCNCCKESTIGFCEVLAKQGLSDDEVLLVVWRRYVAPYLKAG